MICVRTLPTLGSPTMPVFRAMVTAVVLQVYVPLAAQCWGRGSAHGRGGVGRVPGGRGQSGGRVVGCRM